MVQHHRRVQLLKFATFCAADTLALLLTDVLVFLQEKDQRFIFAAVVSLKLHSAVESEARSQALGPFLSIPQPAFHGYLLLFSPPGPEASCDSPAEADRPRGGQRGERNVPDLRLLGGPGDVRGSHQHPRREERLDEAHTAGRGEVRARRCAQRIHFLFVLLRVRATHYHPRRPACQLPRGGGGGAVRRDGGSPASGRGEGAETHQVPR